MKFLLLLLLLTSCAEKDDEDPVPEPIEKEEEDDDEIMGTDSNGKYCFYAEMFCNDLDCASVSCP